MFRKTLVLCVIALFICITIVPSNAIKQVVEKPLTMPSVSKTLYVGGNGSGNYTRIQDALDNASDGDTVFVYNDSSPYHECIEIPRSITLLGEDKFSTIIDGEKRLNIITVNDWYAKISGFTIKKNNDPNKRPYYGIYIGNDYDEITISDTIISNIETGISVGSSFNQIIDNTFFNCGLYVPFYSFGNTVLGNKVNNKSLVYLKNQYQKTIEDAGQVILIDCQNINIKNSNISNVYNGISLRNSDNCIINDNILTHSNIILLDSNKNEVKNNTISLIKARTMYEEIGIRLSSSNENILSKNKIYSNRGYGFKIEYSNYNIISNNEIKDNQNGIYLHDSNENFIKNNNFLENNKNADFLDSKNTLWNSNYWGKSRIFPKIIIGSITIRPPGWGTPGVYFLWINIDWIPAKEPYDLGVVI